MVKKRVVLLFDCFESRFGAKYIFNETVNRIFQLSFVCSMLNKNLRFHNTLKLRPLFLEVAIYVWRMMYLNAFQDKKMRYDRLLKNISNYLIILFL